MITIGLFSNGDIFRLSIAQYPLLQGGLVSSKISGLGTSFGLLVHVLPWPNNRFVWTSSIL